MSRLPSELNASDPVLNDVYREVYEVMDRPVPPNFYTAMSARPDLNAATWQLGQLPPSVTWLAVAAISLRAGCDYCEVTYGRALETMGMDRAMVESCLTDPDDPKLSPLHREIIRFALKAGDEPNAIEDCDVQKLRELGVNDGELVEVALVVAFTKLINTWAGATAIPLDPAH